MCIRDSRDAARQARTSELGYQQSLNAMVVNTSLISNLIFPIVMLVGLFLAFDGRLTMGTCLLYTSRCV